MKFEKIVAFSILLVLFTGCKKFSAGAQVVEERTVYAVDKSYLLPHKRQCEAEHGTFCAKVVEDTSVSANAYSNELSTTEYLLTCKKPKHTPSKPDCVIIE